MSATDQIPPGHGEAEPVGAVAGNESLALPLPRIAPPVAFTPVCPRCWYQHDETEECPS